MPKELLVAGPAGTGKTLPILRVLHVLLKENPGLRVLILRATRVSLTQSALVTYEEEVLPADGMERLAAGAGRANRLAYVYPNGATLVPAGLDRSPDRILSTTWDIVFINEATAVRQEVWETLASRLRRPGRHTACGWLWGDTNPSTPDHWLKARCDAGKTMLWETSHEANPAMWDGRQWTAAGLAYLDQLDQLSGPRRKRLRDGLWVQGEGVWFDTFDPDVHISERAEYDPNLKVYLAIDTGVHTGAVWFQVRETGQDRHVTVFADYYDYNSGATAVAQAIMARSQERCGGRLDRIVADPAGNARTGIGPTILGEFDRAGLHRIEGWPIRPVNDGLELVQAFLGGEGEHAPGLLVHPRCTSLRNAFGGYLRAQHNGQWIDRPVDPAHPHEEMLDALRGGLCAVFPEGRKPQPVFRRVRPGRIF